VRFRYGIDPPPADEARPLLERGRALWQDRDRLLRPVGGRQDDAAEQQIRDDLLDVTLAWAPLLVRTAAGRDAEKARRDALRVLDEAAELFGPGPALSLERQRLAPPVERGEPPPDLAFTPRSAREHGDLGRALLRAGRFEDAAAELQRGLELRPQDFWLNFDEGLCSYRLRRYAEAASAFRVCIALAPETAECFYNKALAETALNRPDEALRDYTHALERNPRLTEAALNRGMLHYRSGRLAASTADLNRALESASRANQRGLIRYNLALVALAQEDRPAALAHLDEAAKLGHAAARELADRLRTESGDAHARPR
jgi:tetratricopeptide (TPR) repeat protein